MRSTSQVLSDHLYPDSRSGYPSYVFRVCRARTITSEGSLLPPGMVGVEADLAREFPFSEEEAVLHLQKGAEEPSRHFISCTFSLPVALYFWATTIRDSLNADPLQVHRRQGSEFTLCIIDVEDSPSARFPTLDDDKLHFLPAFNRCPNSVLNHSNASCDALLWNEVEEDRVLKRIAMPTWYAVMIPRLRAIVQKVIKGAKQVSLREFEAELMAACEADECRAWTIWFPRIRRSNRSIMYNDVLDCLRLPSRLISPSQAYTIEQPLEIAVLGRLNAILIALKTSEFLPHKIRAASNVVATYMDVARLTRSTPELQATLKDVKGILLLLTAAAGAVEGVDFDTTTIASLAKTAVSLLDGSQGGESGAVMKSAHITMSLGELIALAVSRGTSQDTWMDETPKRGSTFTLGSPSSRGSM